MSVARHERAIVVGAGVAGLSCARALAAAGREVVVLERARGVGGRCATRRVESPVTSGPEAGSPPASPATIPVDYGVLFLHGRDPDFLAELARVPATAIDGHPRTVQGAGRPCQPAAFDAGERRLAFVEGVSAFPKHLAAGLDVRTGARVTALALDDGLLRVLVEGREPLAARRVVLALAAEQALALLDAARVPGLETPRALLGMVRSQPCLTVIAGYPAEVAPGWDVLYPDDSRIVQLVGHESAKRERAAATVLVVQAHPRWSREHLGEDRWPDLLLDEAARLLGPWARAPLFTQPHRWKHARTDRGAELSAPLWYALPGGARLGLAGELFAPGGGVEGAWLSGQRLARRILAEENR